MQQEYHESAAPATRDPYALCSVCQRWHATAIDCASDLNRWRTYGVPGQPYSYYYTPPVGRLLEAIRDHCGIGGTFRPGNRQLAEWMGYASAAQLPPLLEQLAYDGYILYDPRTGLITRLWDGQSSDTEGDASYDDIDNTTSSNRPVVAGFVYVVKCANAFKIGCSANVQKRISQLSLPEKELVVTIESDDMYRDEAALHDYFQSKQINGEWFKLTAKDIQWLKKWRIEAENESIDHTDRSIAPQDRATLDPVASSADSSFPRPIAGNTPIDLPDRSNAYMEDSCLTTTESNSEFVVVTKTQIPCAPNSISPTDHPIAILLSELAPPPGRGVLDRVLAARQWTPQQIRDRWEFDQRRIAASDGTKTIGIFWTALMAGELAPARRDPQRPLDPADYANTPGFALGSDLPPPDEPESIRDHAARLLPPPTADTLTIHTRDWLFLQGRIGAGDTDQEALAALDAYRTAVRR